MKKAFTIIELLVVLSLFSAILLIPTFNFDKTKTIVLLNSTAKDIANKLELIKSQAISSSSIMELEAQKTKVIIKKQSLITNSFVDISSVNLPKNISIDTPIKFRFSQNGFPLVGYTGTIKLLSPFGQTKKIILSSFGRIRIE